MAYADKTLSCSDCAKEFIFTAGEQEFHASKGFANEPRRCPDCRRLRKTEQGGARPVREMFTVPCATCGKEAKVPFEPRGDRPVYCSDCFQPPPRPEGGVFGARPGGGGRGGQPDGDRGPYRGGDRDRDRGGYSERPPADPGFGDGGGYSRASYGERGDRRGERGGRGSRRP